jgi:hypothetical protein
MSYQKPLPVPEIAPAQVWDGLAADAQAGAIRLMANLASHLLAQHPESTHQEAAPCHHDPLPSRFVPSTSTARP